MKTSSSFAHSEVQINKKRNFMHEIEDIQLWISSKNTWHQIREVTVQCSWSQSMWFSHSTPSYTLILLCSKPNPLYSYSQKLD
ncbi:hypothetical protein YC2023_115226 [Brassica napus]